MQGGTTGQLLRERGYIHSSAAQLDDVIGQAQAVRCRRAYGPQAFITLGTYWLAYSAACRR